MQQQLTSRCVIDKERGREREREHSESRAITVNRIFNSNYENMAALCGYCALCDWLWCANKMCEYARNWEIHKKLYLYRYIYVCCCLFLPKTRQKLKMKQKQQQRRQQQQLHSKKIIYNCIYRMFSTWKIRHTRQKQHNCVQKCTVTPTANWFGNALVCF